MVLIVDDEYALCEVMLEILELSDISAFCAGNGEEGVALFTEHSHEIELIFLDLHLPGMGGLATLQLLREIKPEIDVILMSGEPESLAMAEFGEQAHLLYLEKPFTLDLLLQTVNKVRPTSA